MRRARTAAALAVALAFATFAAPVEGQSRGSVTGLTVSARAGYDMDTNVFVVGAGVRSGLWRLPFEAQLAGDLTFLRDDVTERQLAVDLLYRLGTGGLAFGGGPVFRNSYYNVTDESLGERETKVGYSLVLALGGVPQWGSRVVTGLEVRWISVDAFDPRTVMAQVGLSLGRW